MPGMDFADFFQLFLSHLSPEEQPGDHKQGYPELDPIDHIFVSQGLQVLNPVYLPPPESTTPQIGERMGGKSNISRQLPD
jgi:hypothetical protein